MSLELYEAGLCGSCGLPRHVCHDPDTEWVAEGPDRCHATTAVIRAKERHGDTNQPQALSWQPVKRD